MKRGILVVSVVLGLILYSHRSGLHEIAVDTALGAGSFFGLCLAVAGLVRVCRRPAGEVRARAAVQPAVVVRPRAGLSALLCGEQCGRPAERMFERWPVCEECYSRLEAAAEQSPAGEPADQAVSRPDVVHDYRLTQPPVFPEGETAGEVDMTEFEKRLSS